MGNKAWKSKPISRKKFTPVKAHEVGPIDCKGTVLLRKFILDRGKIRVRRVIGITAQEQRSIAKAAKNTREVALLLYLSSAR